MHSLGSTASLRQVRLTVDTGRSQSSCKTWNNKKNVFFLRGRGSKPSEVDPTRHRGLTPHLLLGLFRCLCCTDADDALLFAQCSQSAACSLHVHRLVRSKVRSGCGIPVCSVHQVWNTACPFKPKNYCFFLKLAQ